MSSLILPRRFTSQPQGAVEVDWGNPLTQELRAILPMNGNIRELVSGIAPDFIGVSSIATPYGISTQFSSGRISVNDSPALDLPQKHTVIARVRFNSIGVDSALVYKGANSAQYSSYSLKLGVCDGGGVAGRINYTVRSSNSAGNVSVASSVVPTLGETIFIAAVSTGTELRLYLDAELDASIASTVTPFNGTTPLRLGSDAKLDGSGARYFLTGSMSDVCLFGRGLEAEEISLLYREPWQLFRAKPRVLYFDVGGGGGNPTGTGSLIISATTASGSGVIVHKGSGALSTPAATLAGSGKVTHNGTGDLDTPAVTAYGTAKLVHKGIGDLTTPAVTLDGTGSIVVAGAVTGSGALTTPAVTLSGSGKVTHKAQGDVVAPAVTLDGAGKLTHTGTGDITTPAVELDGYDQATPVEPDLPSYGGWRYHPYLHIRRKEDEKDTEIEASQLPAKQIKKAKRAEVARTAERESEEQDQFERGLLDKLESVLEGKVLAVADDLTEARNKKLETQRIEAYKLELLQIAIQEEDELMLILLAA